MADVGNYKYDLNRITEKLAVSRKVDALVGLNFNEGTSAMKVTKNKSHDKMTLRVADGKSWTRLTISRSGWKITGRGSEIKDVALKIKSLIEEALDAGFNYSDALDYVEDEINNVID